MTRKKWTKLKRKMPQLFAGLPAWEFMTPEERLLMKPVSAKAAIARMHSLALSSYAEFEHGMENGWFWDSFNPEVLHPGLKALLPDTPAPGQAVTVTVPAQWNFALDPAYPTQDYTVVNGEYQPVKP